MAATHFIPPADEDVSPESTAQDPPTGAAAEVGNACQCGHIEGAHEHYRRGTDCALCSCARYRKSDRLRRRRPLP